MITVTGNSIIIPQGETGSISFAFKNNMTNDPLVLKGTELEHHIEVVVKDKLSNQSNNVIEPKTYLLENIDDDNNGWKIFDKVVEVTKSYVSEPEIEINTLYLNKTDTYTYCYYYVGETEKDRRDYDYRNSSITVDFNRDDTKNLQPKTYYLEISHITTNKDGDQTKRTLLSPIDFIVKGALR